MSENNSNLRRLIREKLGSYSDVSGYVGDDHKQADVFMSRIGVITGENYAASIESGKRYVTMHCQESDEVGT